MTPASPGPSEAAKGVIARDRDFSPPPSGLAVKPHEAMTRADDITRASLERDIESLKQDVKTFREATHDAF